MNARQLSVELDAAGLDANAQAAVCKAFAVLSSFLKENVTAQKGIGGFVFRTLFPKTSEGLAAVARLLDEYVAAHCG